MRLKLYPTVICFFILYSLSIKGDNFVCDDICYKIHPTDKTVIVVYCNKKDTSIFIPNSVNHDGITYVVSGIDYWALNNCTNVKQIHFPATCKNIRSGCFRYCSSLERITVSPDNPVLKDIDGVLFSKTGEQLICYPTNKEGRMYSIPKGTKIICESAFFKCRDLERLDIPQSVTTINNAAFMNCINLKTVNIPLLVQELSDFAFYGCIQLKTISVHNPKIKYIGEYTFSKETFENATLIVPSHVIDSFRRNKYWKRFSHIITSN